MNAKSVKKFDLNEIGISALGKLNQQLIKGGSSSPISLDKKIYSNLDISNGFRIVRVSPDISNGF